MWLNLAVVSNRELTAPRSASAMVQSCQHQGFSSVQHLEPLRPTPAPAHTAPGNAACRGRSSNCPFAAPRLSDMLHVCSPWCQHRRRAGSVPDLRWLLTNRCDTLLLLKGFLRGPSAGQVDVLAAGVAALWEFMQLCWHLCMVFAAVLCCQGPDLDDAAWAGTAAM